MAKSLAKLFSMLMPKAALSTVLVGHDVGGHGRMVFARSIL
jgi:hypothetical protein